VGTAVGSVTGEWVSEPVRGACVGFTVGAREWRADGFTDGLRVGAADGFALGALLGRLDGTNVGSVDGIMVGPDVIVGGTDGEGVGNPG
jgi:hypothetical protein